MFIKILAAVLTLLTTAVHAANDTPDDPCPSLFSAQAEAYASSDLTMTYGRGQVTYVHGAAVATNRWVTEYIDQNSLMVNETHTPRPTPEQIPYPNDSYSELSLRTLPNGEPELIVEEYWGFNQKLPHGRASAQGLKLGEGDFFVKMHMPIKFSSGSVKEFEDGRPVRFQVTDAGARLAAKLLRDRLVTLSSRQPHLKSIRAEMMSSQQRANVLEESLEMMKTMIKMMDDGAEDFVPANASIESFFAGGEMDEINRMMKVKVDVINASPALRIEGGGTKDSMTLDYLDEVTVQLHAVTDLNFDD